jgi:hypothetical protein
MASSLAPLRAINPDPGMLLCHGHPSDYKAHIHPPRTACARLQARSHADNAHKCIRRVGYFAFPLN